MKLLDLFCCAGGASMGYHQAGFEVTGVDIVEQKEYPFTFIQADAITYCKEHNTGYTVTKFISNKAREWFFNYIDSLEL